MKAVLLFGSETWNLSSSAIKYLECFHMKAARQMPGMVPKERDDITWLYPLPRDILEAAGLYTVSHYIEVRK